MVDRAAPHLFHRSAPCGDPVRAGDLSVPRSLLGAAARAQRPPRLGGEPHHLRHGVAARGAALARREDALRRRRRAARRPGARAARLSDPRPTARSIIRSCCTPSAAIIAARSAASRACASTPTATSSRSPAGGAAGRARWSMCSRRSGAVIESHADSGRPAEQMLFRRAATSIRCTSRPAAGSSIGAKTDRRGDGLACGRHVHKRVHDCRLPAHAQERVGAGEQ